MVAATRKRKRKKYGVGINDADYVVSGDRKGNAWKACPYYIVWNNMLLRCYSERYQELHQSYKGCTVCDEWHTFSNFKAWMEQQDWEGKALDKDLLVLGNKVYNPDACIFVTQQVNKFMTEKQITGSTTPIGVHLRPSGKFIAQCGNLVGGQKVLGLFNSAEDAHKAYKEYKTLMAIKLASIQTELRISEALLKRYCKE